MVIPLRLSAAALLASAALSFAAPKIDEREAASYRIVTLPTPEGITMEAGALCCLGPDKLACSSRIGDIWIADGVLGDDPKPKWKLFASGLHEVLGLAVRPGEKDGWIYCTQRCEVTRMRDINNDGRADEFETVSDAWGIGGDYHEYAFGSKFDKEGNMWVVLCLTGSFTSDNPFRGWCLKITPDGKTIPAIPGIRSPGGIGYNAEGDLFYTDNQGPWNGACKLQWLKPGSFVGHPGGLKWFDEPSTRDAIAKAGLKKPATPQDKSRMYVEREKIPELLPPAVYFPYPKMGQSAAGFACDLTGGKFGPFAEQLFVGDQTQSIVMRASLEKVNGFYQGACFPFRSGFGSGALGLEFASDGSLFVYGTDRGWGARGGKPFSLQRVVFTGTVPFEFLDMHAKPDGFEFTFTEPVDPKTASDPANWTAETYTYIYQASYGSPEVDQTKPAIKSITVAPDGRSARLILSEMKIGHVHEFHAAGVRSAKGTPLLHDAAYYTLFQTPKS
jgi:hypothetical protein